jgi:hypothetical protein
MFLLYFFEIPKGVRRRLDYYRSRFFWQSDELKKYRLTKWNTICRPKDQEGLGIEVLDIKNKCLLSKWLFKLLSEEGVRRGCGRNYYPINTSVAKRSPKYKQNQLIRLFGKD